jgi:hypothetical protein
MGKCDVMRNKIEKMLSCFSFPDLRKILKFGNIMSKIYAYRSEMYVLPSCNMHFNIYDYRLKK